MAAERLEEDPRGPLREALAGAGQYQRKHAVAVGAGGEERSRPFPQSLRAVGHDDVGEERAPASEVDREALDVSLGIDERDPARLVEVVVVAVVPEKWDAGCAARPLDRAREDDRVGRLVKSEERAAEETGLLARDDGDGARVAEAVGRRPRLRGRAERCQRSG